MTTREVYAAVIEANLSDEITEFFVYAIDKLDERKAKAAAKRNSDWEQTKRDVLPVFNIGVPMTCAEVRDSLGSETFTSAKVSAILRKLVEEGNLSACLTERTGKPTKEYYINPDKTN